MIALYRDFELITHETDFSNTEFIECEFDVGCFRDSIMIGASFTNSRGSIDKTGLSYEQLIVVDWTSARDQMSEVFWRVPGSAMAVLKALRNGLVEGDFYVSPRCACLKGWACISGVGLEKALYHISAAAHNLGITLSPQSQLEWFVSHIHEGDTPEINIFARLLESWIVGYLIEEGV